MIESPREPASTPSLSVRGFHLNFESYQRMRVDEAVRLMEVAASVRMNVLLVEYGPRFPFESHPYLRAANALTVADVERLLAEAARLGLEVIPLQQSIAHLEYVLRHEQHAGLRERAGRDNLLCPTHPDVMPLVKSLVQEVMSRHPKATRFHLGGDEARKVGQCSRCEPRRRQLSVGGIYGGHMGDLARMVLDNGRRPIIWDDTPCAFPDALDYLPRETIINYWDYIVVADPTPVLIPRMAHIDGAPRVVHDWRWMLPGRRKAVSEVQRDVMKNYSHAARLPGALGKRYLAEFGKYLGYAFPRWVRALPYLEYYQDRGFDVITSPTAMGNGDMVDGRPNIARLEANITTHAKRCKENGRALGMITTAWYNMPPELLVDRITLSGRSTW
ncbi:MAG: family 20 glycosylhydrolase [Planctomycetes bacterium]|nr:family 20 glycosylhydrolase [Planctomycetota bacterium]